MQLQMVHPRNKAKLGCYRHSKINSWGVNQILNKAPIDNSLYPGLDFAPVSNHGNSAWYNSQQQQQRAASVGGWDISHKALRGLGIQPSPVVGVFRC